VTINYKPQSDFTPSTTDSTQQRENIILRLRDTSKDIDFLLSTREVILEGELAKISGGKYRGYYFVLTKTDLRYYAPSGYVFSSSLSLQRSIPLINMQIR
jgi:hypothetical protein